VVNTELLKLKSCVFKLPSSNLELIVQNLGVLIEETEGQSTDPDRHPC
jgi:hypothetical protein